MKIVVSNNSHVYGLLLSPAFRRAYASLDVEEEMEGILRRIEEGARLAIVDTELYDASGFDVVREIKHRWPEARVLLLAHGGMDGSEIREAMEAGVDEISMVPLQEDVFLGQFLRLVGAPHRRLPRIDLTDGEEYVTIRSPKGVEVRARLLDLHTAGCKLLFSEEVPASVDIEIVLEGTNISGVIVWERERDDGLVAGVSFLGTSEEARGLIQQIISWRIEPAGDGWSVYFRRPITHSLPFPVLVDRIGAGSSPIVFDLHRVKDISPPGAVAWADVLAQLGDRPFRYKNVRPPVLYQMMMMPDRFPGTVENVVLRYSCPSCGVSYEAGAAERSCRVCGAPLAPALPPEALTFLASRAPH